MKDFEGYIISKHNTTVKHIDDESISIMNEILDIVSEIDAKDDDTRKLWLTIDRGTLTNYKRCKNYNTDIKNKKDFLEYYPDETIWFEFWATRNKYGKVITVNNFSFEILEADEKDVYANNYSEFLLWVKERVQAVIEDIRKGDYNDRVARELPYEYRYGTIKRKVYWDNLPEYREEMYEGITVEERKRFLDILQSENAKDIPENLVKDMTFNKYFEMAYPCYKALGKETRGSIKDTFFAYAEDFGGGVLYNEIDYNSTQDFDDFVDKKKGNMGGHPWGIRRGSSRHRLMLYPKRTENGYYFRFSGNPNWNIFGIIKCYLTLKDSGVPVVFFCPEETITYLKEEDLIGFVSSKVMPIYCQLSFPNEDVDDFRHYDAEKHAKIFNLINWRPIKEVKLKK